MKKIRKKGRRKVDVREEGWIHKGQPISASIARRAGEDEGAFLARWERERDRKLGLCPPDAAAPEEAPTEPSGDSGE